MRVIIAETKKIDWNLNPAQYKLEPDEGDPNAVKVDVIFEHDPASPANIKVKQIIRKSTGEDLLPQLGKFDLPRLERSISERMATQDTDFNDPFWSSFGDPGPDSPNENRGPGFEQSYSLGNFQ